MSRQLQSRPYTTWQLIKSYWLSQDRYVAFLLLFTVILMTMALVGFGVLLNYWYNYFYDALQDYDKKSVYDLLWVFLFLVTLLIVISVYRYYLQSYLALRWRRWLTDQFINRWLQKKSYYYLENFDESTDNPDQRIQQDIGLLVTNALALLVGFISSVATLIAFISILWHLSGTYIIPLGHFGELHIPGYLAWVGLIYATIGTFITFKIGHPLVPLNFEQQRREANFRFAAIDLRTHAEHIALYRGEAQQKKILDRLVESFLQNWYMIILRQKLLLWFTAGYNQIAILVPLAAALPNYFGKVFKLGGLQQTLRAFAEVQEALSFFVNAFTTIAEFQAVNQRLITFLNHIYEVEKNAKLEGHFEFHWNSEHKIITRHITLFTPRGLRLLEDINEVFVHGQNYLIKGVSGIGKSTFVRAIAKIWPYGSGEIYLPRHQKIMYIPQKSYMPLGTLRDTLLFPDHIHAISDEKLIDLLNLCGLPELTNRMHDVAMWSQQLSPGEQQRVSFLRIFVHQPDWVFLDESTSALDINSEKMLYELLKTQVPNCSVISVGHRPSIAAYHDHEINMSKYSVEKVVAEQP